MNVAAIVLAAGTSSRMGRPKLLLPYEGKTLVRRAVEGAVASRAKQVIVVTGAYRDEVERELRGLPSVKLAHNAEFAEGMSGSVRAGVRAVRPETDAVLIMLADQPFVDAAILDALIELYDRTRAPIVRPRYAGVPGNPVLWDRALFGELMDQTGDQGGRALLRAHAERIVWRELPDARGQQDVDTPEAYAALVGRADSESAAEQHVHGHVHETPAADRAASGPDFCARCGHSLERGTFEGKSLLRCPSCDTFVWSDPKVAVAVVLPWEGGILLGRRTIDPGLGKWSFPSGYVDRGEVLEEAARREVFEETGLRVRLDGLVGAYSTAGDPVVLIVYAGAVEFGTPSAGPEVGELRAFDPDALPAMAFDHDDRIIRDWRAGGWSVAPSSPDATPLAASAAPITSPVPSMSVLAGPETGSQ